MGGPAMVELRRASTADTVHKRQVALEVVRTMVVRHRAFDSRVVSRGPLTEGFRDMQLSHSTFLASAAAVAFTAVEAEASTVEAEAGSMVEAAAVGIVAAAIIAN